MTNWWWLSFCDPDKPEGSQFLGACIVDGEDFSDALSVAWAAKCNPGGEIAFVQIGETIPEEAANWPKYTLLSRDQIKELETQYD